MSVGVEDTSSVGALTESGGFGVRWRMGMRWMNSVVAVGMTLLATAVWGETQVYHLEVGPETTRVMGPRLADGTIDYTAAIWEKMSEGVTEENNAWSLLGPAIGGWKRFSEGVEGKRFDQLDRQRVEAMKRPWKAEEFPEVARWLQENDAVLSAAMKASVRSRLCFPKPVEKDDEILNPPKLGNFREMGGAMVATAMLKAGGGDQAGARDELAAAHRLARLLANWPNLLGPLVAIAIDGEGCRAALGGARVANEAEAKKWLAMYREMPEIELNPAALDVDDRYSTLRQVMRVLHGHLDKALSEMTMLNVEPMFVEARRNKKFAPGDLDQVDWNVVLRHINAVYNEAVNICGEKDASKHAEAWAKFAENLKKQRVPGSFMDALGGSMLEPKKGDLETRTKQMIQDVEEYLRRHKDETREAYSKRIGAYFTAPVLPIGGSVKLVDRYQCVQRIYVVGMALEAYQTKNGQYPETLELLKKDYLKELPKDLFSGKDLVYRREFAGYLLYSVGPNGVDEGGRKDGEADDIAVHGAAR